MTYSGSLTREQFMFQEMRIVAKLLSEGMSDEDVLRRVDIFLSTPFEGGRHARRVDEIMAIENK